MTCWRSCTFRKSTGARSGAPTRSSGSTSHREVRSANSFIKRRTNVVGIFPNDAAITRLVGSQLLEQQEEWQLERRRFFSEASMAKIPEPEEAIVITHGDPSDQAATTTS